jgi:MYXO-CTERM domain-containing protein
MRHAKPFAIAVLAILAAPLSASGQTKVWTTTADFDTGALNNVSDTRVADQVMLGPTAVSKTRNIWTDNFNYGLVLRLDSVTGKQTSRIDSVLNTINGVSTGLRPANEVCDWANHGNCPGRVAVDTRGDVWIVNRAFGTIGSLSKFSGSTANCIDRNNNGKIDTSTDVNGDGTIDMQATGAAQEYFGQSDECILTTIPVGVANALPRGVAVDRWGKIWVGTHNEGKVYRFNPNDPVTLELVVTTGGNPYSMATGGDYLFVSNSNGAGPVYRVNVLTGAVDTAPCGGTYGVVGDPGGTIAYFGGHFNNANGVWKADFAAHTCTLLSNPSGNMAATAVTIDTQPAPGPYVWSANYNSSTYSKYSPTTGHIQTWASPTGSSYPHGLSVDFDGYVWLVTNNHTASKQMAKLNPATGAVVSQAFIGFLASDQAKYPAIGGFYSDSATPYLYSDFTGVQIDRQAPYTYLGDWQGTYDGGAPGIPWRKVSWTGSVPNVYTTLTMAVRAADTIATLGTTPYSITTSGATLSGIKGRFVQVRSDLKGPGWSTSALLDATVVGPCDTLGQACCVKDADCSDGNACTNDTCPVPGGACVHTAIPGCCNTAADCNDSNACTSDACPGAGKTCTHAPVAGCCNSNADCADTNLCTADICSGPGGTCTHPTINGCCNTDLDCTKGNKCSSATCPTPGGFCTGGGIPGCCNNDSDCADTDLCTLDKCDLATSTCSNTKVTGCCNTDGECTDGNSCTADHCSGPGGSCVFSPIPGCCAPGDPKLGTPCDAPVSPYDKPPCKAGHYECSAGKFVCVGAVKPSFDVCDGVDNNCDGVVDIPSSCEAGKVCVTGVCVSPCTTSEFPCPTGYSCVGGYCMPPSCASVTCPTGQICVNGECQATGGDGGTDGGDDGGTTDAGNDAGDGSVGDGATDGSLGDAGDDGGGGGGGTGNDSGGCGCEVPGSGPAPTGAGLLGLAIAGLAVSARRRSRVARGVRGGAR